MFDLLKALLGPLVTYIEPFIPYLPFIIGGLLAVALIVRFGLGWAIPYVARLRSRTPKALFNAKQTLLARDCRTDR